MRRTLFVALALVTACSGGGDGKDQEGTAAVDKAALKLEPGEWEMTTEIKEMTLAGQPAPGPGAGTKVTTKSCITPEQVEQPNAAMFAGSEGTCKYDSFYMSRGRIVSAMSCANPNGQGKTVMSMEGTYTPQTMDATVSLTTSVSVQGDMKMTSQLSGKRLGPCTAESATKTS